jgi:hypothetical protein
MYSTPAAALEDQFCTPEHDQRVRHKSAIWNFGRSKYPTPPAAKQVGLKGQEGTPDGVAEAGGEEPNGRNRWL